MIATIERDVVITSVAINNDFKSGDVTARVDLCETSDITRWMHGKATVIHVDHLRGGSEIKAMEALCRNHSKLKFSLCGEIPTAPDLLERAGKLARSGDVKGATKLAIEAMQEIARKT
jgi:hypothetical protein